MAIEIIDQPTVYFGNLGDLHDALVTEFSWSKPNRQFNICVDDIYSNFSGLPEYKGIQPGEVMFFDVASIDCDMQIFDHDYSICSINCEDIEDGYKVEIRCSPGGYFKFFCDKICIKLL